LEHRVAGEQGSCHRWRAKGVGTLAAHTRRVEAALTTAGLGAGVAGGGGSDKLKVAKDLWW